MRTFACPVCGRILTFGSTWCVHCGTAIAFDWATRDTVALAPGDRRCASAPYTGCNGLGDGPEGLCFSCALTRTRPNDADPAGLAQLALAEAEKRRLIFELAELSLPVRNWREGGLAFDLLSSADEPVTTGHADGVVTLDLAEADPAHRAEMRLKMGEPYRTLLGHFRHEIGHYYEPVLTPDGSLEREQARALFGDERRDYAAAMSRHYEEGAPADWQDRFVSAYASMHPWEDWAETFAHYLHIRDALQTAAEWGVEVLGPPRAVSDPAPVQANPEAAVDGSVLWEELLDTWLPLTYALNALNRSMGAPDPYPFVITPAVSEKLRFLHDLMAHRMLA